MKKFIAIYNAPAEVLAQMENATPEQKAAGMEPWMAWKAQHDANIVDFGAPLTPGQNVNQEGNWNGSGTQVSGYSIVQGESLESVKGMFTNHPHISWAAGCSIDIHECVSM
ncbi:MAG: hypothetical protein AAF587_19940 [Bacteroidota bacterium]